MRIVQLNPFHYPFMGGIEHRVHHLSSILSRRHEVIVVTGRLPGTEREEEMDGYSVVRLPSRLYSSYNPPHIVTGGILERLKDLSPDVVDFHYRWSGSYRRAMRRYRGGKVFTFHNTFGEGEGIYGALSTLNDIGCSRFFRGFDRVVCVSEFVRRDLERRGFPPGLLRAVPNGVVVPEEPMGKEGDFILFLGRLVRTKGLHHLLEAMRWVDFPLVIAGGGPEEERLRRMVSRNGLGGRVEIRGRVSEEEKHRLLSECRLFVFPSCWESYGIAAAEAMAHAKPVVASEVGGLPEVVQDAGMLVPPRDEVALADAINTLLRDEVRRAALGRRGRELALTYNWERRAREMEDIYSEVASGYQKGRG